MDNQQTLLTSTQQRARQQMADYNRYIDGFTAVDEGASETVRALCTTLEHWILTEYKREARTSNDVDMKLHDVVISHTLRTIELVVTLEERANYQIHWKDQLEEKEVSRG